MAAALILWCALFCFQQVFDDDPFGPPAPEMSLQSADPDELRGFALEPVSLPPLIGSPSSKQQQVFQRIRAGWQARHERIHSLDIAWDFGPGDGTEMNSRRPSGREEHGHTELWIDGDLRRRSLTSSPPNAKPYLGTYDGMTTRVWNPQERKGEVWNGQPEKGFVAGGYPNIWLLAIDPLRHHSVDISSLDVKVLGENAIIGDRHCVKLRFPMKGTEMVDTLWIDPARDNVVVGWERGTPDRSRRVCDDRVLRDKQHGWLPTRWYLARPSPPGDSFATATRIAINEQYPITMFRLTFPAGAQVEDRKLAQRYVMAADGSKTQIRMFIRLEMLETIYDSLNRPTDFVVDREPLKDALEFIARRFQIKTAFDEAAVRQGRIDPSVEVETQKHGIKLKELLDVLLKQSPKPLRYEIRDDVVTVIAYPK